MSLQQPILLEVSPAALAAIGAELTAVGTDLGGVLARLRVSAVDAGPATGSYATPAAYDQMWRLWELQVNTLVGALSELGGRVVAAARTYRAADDAAVPGHR